MTCIYLPNSAKNLKNIIKLAEIKSKVIISGTDRWHLSFHMRCKYVLPFEENFYILMLHIQAAASSKCPYGYVVSEEWQVLC